MSVTLRTGATLELKEKNLIGQLLIVTIKNKMLFI